MDIFVLLSAAKRLVAYTLLLDLMGGWEPCGAYLTGSAVRQTRVMDRP
jgi:hypothetical protein